ncbi:MAG: cytidine deaminase [Deltaproteobacteria bacterium]
MATLDAALLALVDAARSIRPRAYAPYSDYRVGAAIRAKDGRVFTGVNVENSAFPTGVCAEVNALTTAVAAGAREFDSIAVVTAPKKPGGRPGAPCGNCRQALSEFAPRLVVALATDDDVPVLTTIDALLPDAFTPEDL